MNVIDAQVHIWDAPRIERPEGWREGVFLADELIADMAMADVDRVVLVPSSHQGDAAANNAYSLAVASDDPERFAVMALLGREPDPFKGYMADLAAIPHVKGFRLHLPNGGWEATDWVWSEAIRLGVPVAVFGGRGSFDTLLSIVDKYPDLSLLLDHVAVPAPGPDPFAEFDRVLGLEKYANVVVKCSALTRYSRETYPFSDVLPYVRRLVETFGPERLAWGSDYTTHSERVSYRETVDLIRVASDWLSVEDREWILSKTLARVLAWDEGLGPAGHRSSEEEAVRGD